MHGEEELMLSLNLPYYYKEQAFENDACFVPILILNSFMFPNQLILKKKIKEKWNNKWVIFS